MLIQCFQDRVRFSPELERGLVAAMEKVAETTDTKDLVVAVYLTRGKQWAGHLVNRWMTPEVFARRMGKWSFVRNHGTPPGLPEKHALIRLRLGVDIPGRRLHDSYGWSFDFGSFFFDGAAWLFGHELHHFRRRFLDLHPREGEHSANKWSLQRCQEAGFQVRLERRIKRRPRKRRQSRGLLGLLRREGPRFAALRALPAGAAVLIKDALNKPRYLGQAAVKVRSLRSDSIRMAIRTPDGRIWHWPMSGLECVFGGAGTPPEDVSVSGSAS